MLTTYFKRQTTRTIYYGGPAGPHLGEDAHNLTLPMAGCFASDSNDAGEGWLPAVARGNLDQKAMDTLDAGVSILSGDDSGLLRGLFALKSVSLSQARSDANRHP